LLADGVERRLAEGRRPPPLGPELVGEQRVLGALEILEEKRRAAGLDRAVDDLRHLEVRVHLRLDLDQLAGAAKLVDPGAEVGRGHDLSLSRRVWRLVGAARVSAWLAAGSHGAAHLGT